MWEMKRLGEVCSIIKRGIAPKYIDAGGTQVINQKCIRDHCINYELARRHNHEIKTVPNERFIKVGDVLVNSTGTGTLGRVAQVRELPDENTTVDTHVTIVRPKDGQFYNDFFGYMLIKIEDEIAASGEGASGQTELSRSVLENKFTVSFPTDLNEQKRIVAVLDEAFAGIDQAIENTEAARAAAQEMFDSSLNAIFTQRGDGWVEKRLKEITLEFARGKSKHRPRNDPTLYGGNYPFVQTGDIRNSDRYVTKHKQSYNDLGLQQSKLWPAGTICITIAANIAETAILTFDACFPDNIIGMVVDPEKSVGAFVEYLLQHTKIKLQEAGKGSAQDNINLGTFENLYFNVPSLETQTQIVKKLDTLAAQRDALVANYTQKLAHLQELKQSLLAQAFSGKLTQKEKAA